METALKVVGAVVLIGLCFVLKGAARNVIFKGREQSSPGFKSTSNMIALAIVGFFILMFIVALISRTASSPAPSQEVYVPRLNPPPPPPSQPKSTHDDVVKEMNKRLADAEERARAAEQAAERARLEANERVRLEQARLEEKVRLWLAGQAAEQERLAEKERLRLTEQAEKERLRLTEQAEKERLRLVAEQLKIVGFLNGGEYIKLSNGKTYEVKYSSNIERCKRWSVGDKVEVMGRHPTRIRNGNEIIEVLTD